jgi:hypothetical protein
VKAAQLALGIIREADPPNQAVLEVGANLTVDAVQGMSFSELMRVAEAHGIEVPSAPELTPPS